MSAADIEVLADLPSRETLLAQFAGALSAPLQQLAGLVQALPRNLAYGISALLEQRQAEAPADRRPRPTRRGPGRRGSGHRDRRGRGRRGPRRRGRRAEPSRPTRPPTEAAPEPRTRHPADEAPAAE